MLDMLDRLEENVAVSMPELLRELGTVDVEPRTLEGVGTLEVL